MYTFLYGDNFWFILLAIVVGLPMVIIFLYAILRFFDFESNPMMGGVTLKCHHCQQLTRASHRVCQHCGGELQ